MAGIVRKENLQNDLILRRYTLDRRVPYDTTSGELKKGDIMAFNADDEAYIKYVAGSEDYLVGIYTGEDIAVGTTEVNVTVTVNADINIDLVVGNESLTELNKIELQKMGTRLFKVVEGTREMI